MNLILRYSLKLLLARYQYPLLIAVIILPGAAVAFGISYLSASNFLIGLCLLPFIIFIDGRQRINYLYLIAVTMFAALAYFYHLKLFYFFAIAFYLIFLLEVFIGRINTLILFLVLLMSPVFLQMAVILGFPIRLHLSQWAGELLSFAGLDIQVEGNLMVMNGFNFTVDEACMGLNMLAISMLMGCFMISHQYRTFRKKLSLSHLTIFFLVVFILNIVSNLFRIICLVLFKILPENPLHEGMGILCLVVYVMIPLYFLAQYMMQRFGKPFGSNHEERTVSKLTNRTLIALSTSIMLIGFTINPGRAAAIVPHAKAKLLDMQAIEMENGITKLSNDKLLIYVKPIPEFFSGEHTPLFCWKGSGYQFKRITKENISGHDLYFGVLTKGNIELHTAWWYTNGTTSTIDQLTWRGEMMKDGDRFCLVNVTAESKKILRAQLADIFANDLLTIKP
jgi:exosortase N